MTLSVWSGFAQVVASLPGPGRVELFAARRAGEPLPDLVVEAYGPEGLVAAGQVALWELNQALAALLADSVQARRLTLRAPADGHGGHLDVIAEGARAQLVATARDGRARAAYETTTDAFAADLNALVRHYLTMTRGSRPSRTLVLPGARQPSARAALSRPNP